VAGRFPRGFALLAVCAAAFVWVSSTELPNVVASHFEADGYANGFTSRAAYILMMLALVVGAPVLMVLAMHFTLGRPNARINLPNREYWLAPERRPETVSYLRGHMGVFAAALMTFLCYMHWLVVRANEVQPPRLPSVWFNAGLATFILFAVLWTRTLLRRFRSRPPAERP
jgi:uncharacterized membrane protein